MHLSSLRAAPTSAITPAQLVDTLLGRLKDSMTYAKATTSSPVA
jgi:hypothetical protein